MADRPIVTGSFRDYDAADRAYMSLRDQGYTDEDIHVLMSEKTKDRYYDRDTVEIEHGSKAMEGAGTGAAVGGSVGGIVGAIAALGTNAIVPGLGLVIAGPLAGALAGAGAGGAAGSIIGALVGAGIPEDRAKTYKDHIENGDIVVGAHPRSDEDRRKLADTFERHGGRDVYY